VTVSLFSYVVARDYGFAPNPFGGHCTLATCKPEIRRLANPGDWVVGTGSSAHGRKANIVYAMKVAEALSFDEYWVDARFQMKKPDLRASTKRAFGDNIYHRENGFWFQLNSHHSFADGSPNPRNIKHDRQTNRVLIATQYAYWGGSGPAVSEELRSYEGHSLCIGRGYKRHFPTGMVECFTSWFTSLNQQGCLARPVDWKRT
jgi:hypothetical protein